MTVSKVVSLHFKWFDLQFKRVHCQEKLGTRARGNAFGASTMYSSYSANSCMSWSKKGQKYMMRIKSLKLPLCSFPPPLSRTFRFIFRLHSFSSWSGYAEERIWEWRREAAGEKWQLFFRKKCFASKLWSDDLPTTWQQISFSPSFPARDKEMWIAVSKLSPKPDLTLIQRQLMCKFADLESNWKQSVGEPFPLGCVKTAEIASTNFVFVSICPLKKSEWFTQLSRKGEK